MKPVRKTLSLPDIQLSYLEWNQSQEPLLLLHGAGGDALVWSSLAVTLANRFFGKIEERFVSANARMQSHPTSLLL